MANRPRKITELPVTSTVTGNDVFIVERVANSSSSTTSKITITNLRLAMVKGPYANDSTANTGGIGVGEMYYTSDGSVKVRVN